MCLINTLGYVVYFILNIGLLYGSSTEANDYVSLQDQMDAMMLRLDQMERREAQHHLQMTEIQRKVGALEIENNRQANEIARLCDIVGSEMKVRGKDNEACRKQKSGQNYTRRTEYPRVYHGSRKHEINVNTKRSSGDTVVAFLATLTSNMNNLGRGQDVTFDHVVTNVGRAYNSHVGVFIAPVSGIYVFSATVVTVQNDVSHFGFAVNGQVVTSLFVNGADNAWDSTAGTVVVELHAGDDVTVINSDAGASLNGQHHCAFSGFLLHQT